MEGREGEVTHTQVEPTAYNRVLLQIVLDPINYRVLLNRGLLIRVLLNRECSIILTIGCFYIESF